MWHLDGATCSAKEKEQSLGFQFDLVGTCLSSSGIWLHSCAVQPKRFGSDSRFYQHWWHLILNARTRVIWSFALVLFQILAVVFWMRCRFSQHCFGILQEIDAYINFFNISFIQTWFLIKMRRKNSLRNHVKMTVESWVYFWRYLVFLSLYFWTSPTITFIPEATFFFFLFKVIVLVLHLLYFCLKSHSYHLLISSKCVPSCLLIIIMPTFSQNLFLNEFSWHTFCRATVIYF